MTIRTKPLHEITEDDIRMLVERDIFEGRTLEFKEELELDHAEGQFEFLKDITAMANESGGRIVYGVREGDGDQRAKVVSLPGLLLPVDTTLQSATNLLRDRVDEPILGVDWEHIHRPDKRWYLILHIPASHLAPHMFRRGKEAFFFRRMGASNNPMDAREIKEVVMRADRAQRAAEGFLEARFEALRKQVDPDSGVKRRGLAALHLISLFPPIGGLDLTRPDVAREFLYPGNPSFSIDGYWSGSEQDSCLLLRRGGAEFVHKRILHQRSGFVGIAYEALAKRLHEDIDDYATKLINRELLSLPLLVSLSLFDVADSRIGADGHQLDRREVFVLPGLIHDWGADAAVQLKRLLDIMWQAYGFPHAPQISDR